MTALTQSALVLLLQSTGLLLLGLTALHLTRKRGPAVQTLIGRATLVGVALLALLPPLTGHIQPVWRIGPPAPNAGGAGSKTQEPTPSQVVTLPAREGEEFKGNRAVPLAAPFDNPAQSSAPAYSVPTVPAPMLPKARTLRLPAPGGQALALRVASAAPGRFLPGGFLPIGFLFVSAALLLWLAVCQRHLTRLRRTSRPVTSGLALALLAALTPNPPRLLTHPSVHSPFLAGLRRPAIFLPAAFETQFDADALRAVFVHELAHEARRDNLWTLASRLLTALLWPQPLLWLLVRKLEQISEDACDEAVLAASCSPRAYADCLLSLATRPPLALSQRTLNAGVAPFRSSVGRRISRILSAKGTRSTPTITPRLRLTAAALTIAAALGGAFLVSSAPAQTTAQIAAPAPFIPTPQELRHEAERKQDVQNLKVIGLAMAMYEQDYHERMPDAKHWMDQITPYLNQIALYRQDPSVFYDPFQPGKKRYGYAFNRNCSNKPLSAFSAPAETVAVFDSTLGTRNASDIGLSLRVNATLSSRINNIGSGYGFVDGHAKWIRPDVHPSFSLDGGQPTALNEAQMRVKSNYLVMHYKGNMRIYGTSNNGTPVLLGATEPNQQLNQAQFLAGMTSVQGPGVIVTLTDSNKPFPGGLPALLMPPNIIHDGDINLVVNELKAAGAEAVAVNDQRLVATSSIRCVGPVVNVNNVSQAPPFVIKAIGDPKTLVAAMTLPGGVGTQLKAFDPAMFTVQQAATLTLPAYSGGNTPRYAKPVGETAEALNAPIQQKLDFLRDTEMKMDAIRAKQVSTPKKQVTVTIDSKSRYFLDNIRVDKSQIEPRLAVLARQNPNITAVVKCSRNQPYARMIGLMDQIKHAGIQAIDIATLSSGPPSSTKPAGGSKPRYAKPVSTSGGMALNSIYEPTVVAALQEQYRSSQLLQMVISANLRALTAALKTTQRKMAQELDIFTPPLPPNAAESSTLRKSKSAYLRKWEALRDANLQVQAGLQSQIREETRQKLELHVQNVELYARISALKRFASSHQVH